MHLWPQIVSINLNTEGNDNRNLELALRLGRVILHLLYELCTKTEITLRTKKWFLDSTLGARYFYAEYSQDLCISLSIIEIRESIMYIT